MYISRDQILKLNLDRFRSLDHINFIIKFNLKKLFYSQLKSSAVFRTLVFGWKRDLFKETVREPKFLKLNHYQAYTNESKKN